MNYLEEIKAFAVNNHEGALGVCMLEIFTHHFMSSGIQFKIFQRGYELVNCIVIQIYISFTQLNELLSKQKMTSSISQI